MKSSICILLLLITVKLQGQISILIEQERLDNDLPEDGIEITEFIFNETITKLGSDFYYHFFQNWFNPSNVTGLSIHIMERPIPGMGGIVTVNVEGHAVYQGFLRPGHQRILDAALFAVERTQEYFVNYEMIRQQLESEDHSGTGIF
jgi:curli production assembly/transport component CsgE